MTTPLKRAAAMVPGPAVALAGKWIDLFSSTALAHPEWQEQADRIALGIGVVLTFGVCLGLAGLAKPTLRLIYGIGIALSVISFIVCWGIWLHLGPPLPGQHAPDPTAWLDAWETIYIAGLAILVPSISIGALSIEEQDSKKFWIVVGLCVLALVLAIIAAYFMLRR